MNTKVFYNEIDPRCCAWLSNLMDAGVISPGVISDTPIQDLKPSDVLGYERAHFFAGIGVWDYALHLAGFSKSGVTWTGSCPCQPFSNAGGRNGFADERHLWPAWFQLIAQCRPDVIFGEQVASKDGLGWLDLVHADLEATNYAVGAVDLCAAGVGAPHIRQRLYFVADANEGRSRRDAGAVSGAQAGTERGVRGEPDGVEFGGAVGSVADDDGWRLQVRPQLVSETNAPSADGHSRGQYVGGCGGAGELGDAAGGLQWRSRFRRSVVRREGETGGSSAGGVLDAWRDPEWIPCRDGKYRPTQPGLQPLAHGAPARVVRLRGYGNGLVAPAAATFISSYLDTQ